MIADNHDDHAGGAAPVEQVAHEGVGGLELRERYRLGLHPGHGEGQDEDEGCPHSTGHGSTQSRQNLGMTNGA